MPSYPIRPKPDEDFYVLWSTVVDAAVGYGTRAEVEAMMVEDHMEWVRKQMKIALDRAVEPAHPALREHLVVSEGPGGPGTLSLDSLYDYAQYLMAGEEGAAASLVNPADW